MPGRIVGQTVDKEGRRSFVNTLQAREQHIRREKATSNICTNQALCALRGLIYLSLLGKNGIDALGRFLYHRIHALAGRLEKLPGYSLPYGRPYFRELVVRCPKPAEEIVTALRQQGIIAGLPLGHYYPDRTHDLLIAVTEKKTAQEIDALIKGLKSL